MFRIVLHTDNAAFGDEPEYEVGRILRQLVRSIEQEGLTDKPLYDYNGHKVGEVIVTEFPFEGRHAPDCPAFSTGGECLCWRSDPEQNPELER